MNRISRTLTFVLLSTLLMILAISIQNRFFPPELPGAKNNPVAEEADNAEGNETPVDADTGDTEPANGDAPSADRDRETGESEQAGDDAQPDDESAKPAESRILKTLGSLDPASGYRMLYTLNSKGATVRRIESGTRKKNGRYRYRDLESEGGYLGSLDCQKMELGCQVGVVGPGTPAAEAGVQAGDVILEINGIPIISPDDLNDYLTDKTERGSTVDLKLARKAGDQTTNLTVTAKLTDKPIEFLAPVNSVSRELPLPESFVLMLHQTASNENWVGIDNELRTGNWNVTETTRDGHPMIEFSYVLTEEKMAAVELSGPVTVIKRYWVEESDSDTIANLSSESWHLLFEVEIQNKSAESLALGYQLDGPTGTPSEGWWYQMKINGSGSFTGLAGARDVVAETVDGRYVFHGTPGLVSNLQKAPVRQQKKNLFDPYGEEAERQVKYFGVDTQYFNVAVFPEPIDGTPFVCDGGMAWPTDIEFPEQKRLHKLVDCTGVIIKKVQLQPNQAYRQKFRIFSGPKDANLLDTYQLDENRAFGWFWMFSKPLCWLLRFFYTVTFQISYAIPIILLTMLVRSLMIPISRKAALNAQMMQYLAPQMKEIKTKYPEDMQKQAQAQRELFRKHNYNPLSGCLMGFIQLPIFIGLYRGLSVDIALRDQPLIPGINWCSNLAAPDQFMRWDSWMPAFLASETGWLGPYLNILPLITIVLFVISAKMFTPPPTDEQQAMMQKAMTFAMFLMGFLFFKVPSALCLYFITSSLWGIIERKLLPKPKLDTSQLATADVTPNSAATPTVSNVKQLEERKRRSRDRKRRLRERES